ncbi:MAG: diguanylate cyclase [Immundisolibacteraceae bacterium]|nr:diguanylate cyclase [Immundisolibacteraceae bacterium]
MSVDYNRNSYDLTEFVDHLRAFFGIIDLEGRLVFVNRAPLVAAGIKIESVLNKEFWLCDWFTYDQRAENLIHSSFQNSLAGEETSDEILVCMGEIFVWCEMNFHPVFDDQGEVIYVVGEGIVIDRRKKIEAEIVDINRSLESLISERTRELEDVNNRLRIISETDHLTQLANRLVYERRLLENISTGQRTDQYLSMLMIDVDFFKAYNDHYGHDFGDIALRTIAGAIRQSLPRKTDLAARYGGEEFVVLLPNTDGETALEMAERVRIGVKALAIQHEFSTVAKMITISVGIGTLKGLELNEINLVKQADTALYDAKAAGRNCCRRSTSWHPTI